MPKKTYNSLYYPISIRLPLELIHQVDNIVRDLNIWKDRSEFIREAILKHIYHWSKTKLKKD